jgi:death-on-curing protein
LTWSYLDLADYLLIAEAVTGVPAEVLAGMPRVTDLASSALSVPASGWQGTEAYPELAQKAGLLAARLAKNHPLPDGNKRAAWLALIEFIERNGYRLEQPEPAEAVDVLLRLASSDLSEADFVEWLRLRLVRDA